LICTCLDFVILSLPIFLLCFLTNFFDFPLPNFLLLFHMDLTASQSAILQVVVISIAPTLLLLFFPKAASGKSSTLLNAAKALSAGGLIGDVFIHSLPSAFKEAEEPDDVGLAVVAGFLMFLFLNLITNGGDGGGGHGGHGHADHSHGEGAGDGVGDGGDIAAALLSAEDLIQDMVSLTSTSLLSSVPESRRPGLTVVVDGDLDASEGDVPTTYVVKSSGRGWVTAEDDEGNKIKKRAKQMLVVDTEAIEGATKMIPEVGEPSLDHPSPSPAGYSSALLLNLLGDLMHNFTDGLFLGLSSSTTFSMTAFMSVLLHEVPHEMGDYAVLRSEGMSKVSQEPRERIELFGQKMQPPSTHTHTRRHPPHAHANFPNPLPSPPPSPLPSLKPSSPKCSPRLAPSLAVSSVS
jgi:zinc transporter ZupT